MRHLGLTLLLTALVALVLGLVLTIAIAPALVASDKDAANNSTAAKTGAPAGYGGR